MDSTTNTIVHSDDTVKVTRSEAKLTTFDNPYDPFEQFVQWHMYDKEKGYDSSERLARIIVQLGGITDDMTVVEEEKVIEEAIDTIIQYDELNIYKKLTRFYEVE